MDVAGIGAFLQSVGFPIAACVGMGMYLKYITDAHREDTHRMEEYHKEEMKSITEAINNNTLVIQKLVDKLDVEAITNV